jgi:hypothetical protein
MRLGATGISVDRRRSMGMSGGAKIDAEVGSVTPIVGALDGPYDQARAAIAQRYRELRNAEQADYEEAVQGAGRTCPATKDCR